MLKRKSIILFVLVVASLSCSPSKQISNAEEEVKAVIRPGTALVECKVLEKGKPDYAIKIIRNQNTLCADRVWLHNDLYCGDPGNEIFQSEDKIKPNAAFSGSGNQFCQEAFVQYVNSPACFQYTTGGRTYYIPPN